MAKSRTLGWIGLGKMGLPISARLVAAGHEVIGFDRADARMQSAHDHGVRAVPAVLDAVAQPLFFTSLPNDEALAALAFSEGLLEAARPGAIWVETSTVSPQISADIAREAELRGILYLRAPVSGNAAIAGSGNLTCFVSGPQSAFDDVLPILQDFTRAQAYLGPVEQARYAKLAVNLMIAVSAAMMGEAIVLARKGNLEWQDILGVLTNSAVASPMVHYKAESLKTRDFRSTFSCLQMAKDLDLILDAGRSAAAALPIAAMTRQIYTALIGRGDGESDFISTVRLAEWLAGLDEPSLTAGERA